jgi:hypothetical protein
MHVQCVRRGTEEGPLIISYIILLQLIRRTLNHAMLINVVVRTCLDLVLF